MKSLKQISLKYNVTKAGLYRRIAKIPNFKKQYMHRAKGKANGQWLINDKAVKLIAKPRHGVRPHHYHHASNHPMTKLDYQRGYDRLVKQNEEQAKTIYNLSKSYQLLAKSVTQPKLKRPRSKQKSGFVKLLKSFFK